MLRLYRYTGRDIFQIDARNSISSRYANYPGYYLSGYRRATGRRLPRQRAGRDEHPLPSHPAAFPLDGDTPIARTSYPCEFTVYPWPMVREMKFTLQLRDAAGKTTRTPAMVRPGT